MAEKRKTPNCKHCLQWVDKSLEDFTKKSNGYYHNECLQVIETERAHYKNLIDYIANLYKVTPTGWMFKQIKEYKEKREYTYVGMEYTLRFMYEVENLQLLEARNSGLGLIPFYYEKARYYYANMSEIKAAMAEVKVDSIPQLIRMERPVVRKRSKKINIEDL